MKITDKTKIGLSYTLTVDGNIVDKATKDKPLEFIYGLGMLLPEFEKHISNKVSGDTFSFTLTPEQGYGVLNNEAVVDLPKDIFLVDGNLLEDATQVGSTLPMGDAEGNRMMGTVKAVNDDSITMDFNHPMAGKTLDFEGEVISVSEASEEDLHAYMAGDCGSCGSGDKSDSGCGSGGCGSGGCGSGGCGDCNG